MHGVTGCLGALGACSSGLLSSIRLYLATSDADFALVNSEAHKRRAASIIFQVVTIYFFLLAVTLCIKLQISPSAMM
jgi:hypothetical protein